jgi:transposase
VARRSTYPNAENCSLAELETSLKAARSSRSRDRLMAIRTLILGYKHEDVASIFNVTLRTIQRWVSSFNARGIDGLIERQRSGRPRKIGPEQALIYHELIEHPEKAEQTHWTAKKFHGYLRDELKEEVGYSTLVRWLHDNNFRLKVPRPWPDRQDEEERRAFIERIKSLLSDSDIELWYADETGIEGDPRPRRRWAKKGSKPKVTKNGDHIRMNVMGMICPRTGEFYALEFSHSDRECFQTFINHAGNDLRRQRSRNFLICDNASWHKAKSLKWGPFEPLYLPPYSPDLNPIERLWLLLKAYWFTDFIAKNREQLIERIDNALLWVMARQINNQRTCSITTKL